MKLAQLIGTEPGKGAVSLESINTAATDPGSVADQIKLFLSGALTAYILPTAFFLVILFAIYGGILYFTAYGNEEKATKGKNTFIWAIVGAIVIALAFVLIRYVGFLTGAEEVQKFDL